MYNTIMKKIFAALHIALFILSIPIIGLMLVMGLSGGAGSGLGYSFLGYLGIFVFSCLTFWKLKFFKFIFFCYFLFGLGFYLDANFWEKHNRDLCNEIKADKYCHETETGFTCTEPSPLGNFGVAKGICKNK